MTERPRSELPDTADLLEGVLHLVTGVVVTAPILPGFLLCVPAIVFFTAAGAVLVVAGLVGALVSAVVGAVFALPYLAIRSLRARRKAAEPLTPVPLRLPTAPSMPPMPAVMPPARKRIGV